MRLPGVITHRIAPAEAEEEHWIPLSDLMTGLMMLFMLLAVLFMLKVEAEGETVKALMRSSEEAARTSEEAARASEEAARLAEAVARSSEATARQMREVAVLYDEMREQLLGDMRRAFDQDLARWHATLDPDLSVRFEGPDVQFERGKAVLQPRFMAVLDEFFPRYIEILSDPKYRDSIEEIRIEGHTSTVWGGNLGADEAYFKNMELSQGRTRSTLEYVLLMPRLAAQKGWMVARVTANGLSSSRPRLNADGSENREASQRVEFRVRTNAEARIGEVLKAGSR